MKKYLITTVSVLVFGTLMAQAPTVNKWAGRLDLFHQDFIGEFVFGQLGVTDRVYVRPGFRVGIERSWITKNHFRMYQDLMLGYYRNTYEERSWTLGTDLGFEWRIFKQFRVAPSLGVHYNNVKATDVRYEYVDDRWVQAKNTDPSISRLQIQTGMNLGWRFHAASAHPIDAFVNGSISAIGPYQPGFGIPALLYKSVGLGLRVGI